MARIFKNPFAFAGDKAEIAELSQPDGRISIEDGWTTNYELPSEDPNYRPVERDEMNGLFNEVTAALGDMQLNGFPSWTTIPGGWPSTAIVAHDGLVWRSTTDSNNGEPGVDATWISIPVTLGEVVEQVAPEDGGLLVDNQKTGTGFERALTESDLSPSITGSATFVHSSNEISLVGIVPALALEIGDVIQVSGSTSNDNLYTVEVINNDNSIVVNYEHRDGAGPLSLADETANVTIKRIAKWYSAPLGLGQMWQDVASQRAAGVIYTNTTGRAIFLSLTLAGYHTNSASNLRVSDTVVGEFKNQATSNVGGTGDQRVPLSSVIPAGATYRVTLGEGHRIDFWAELR